MNKLSAFGSYSPMGQDFFSSMAETLTEAAVSTTQEFVQDVGQDIGILPAETVPVLSAEPPPPGPIYIQPTQQQIIQPAPSPGMIEKFKAWYNTGKVAGVDAKYIVWATTAVLVGAIIYAMMPKKTKRNPFKKNSRKRRRKSKRNPVHNTKSNPRRRKSRRRKSKRNPVKTAKVNPRRRRKSKRNPVKAAKTNPRRRSRRRSGRRKK